MPSAIAAGNVICEDTFPSNNSSAIFLLLSRYLTGVAENPKTLASLFKSIRVFTPSPHFSAPAL